ncbi:MAG: response regulator transcription factor [Oscillospiraceae bacterium]|nr:response regulator transcription factor [Oscillospiraceae bacterium]
MNDQLNNGTVLVVDDEPEIRQLLRILLKNKGYATIEAGNGREAIQLAGEHPETDLILMDIMMPGCSGIEACRQIRKVSRAPILFLTARNTEADRQAAYDNGGDDYLPKPFSQAELIMKVSSLIRRYRVYGGVPNAELRRARAADLLLLDEVGCRVRKNGQEIRLTDKEMELLRFLMNNRGRILDVRTLYEAVWQNRYMPSSDNNVMVYIQRLRKKLEDDPANPALIRTVYGRGYQID